MNKLSVMVTPKETSLVWKIAANVHNEYCPSGEASEITKQDFFHYGIIRLMEAKRGYDPSRGVPWMAFAAKQVRWAMLDQLRRQPAIKIPQDPYQKIKALRKARLELAETGVDIKAEVLAEKLGWSIGEVHAVSGMSPTLLSAETESKDGEEEEGFRGVALMATGDNPETAAIRKEAAELVNRCLEALPSLDRLVIRSRILERVTLRELAEPLNCSLENVRLWQKRAEEKMRQCLKRYGLINGIS